MGPLAGSLEIAPVQILRAIAAIGVAILHVAQAAGIFVGRQGEAPYPWLKFLPWDAGVDLFFVISGFVMVYASVKLFGRTGGVRQFLGRRVARVVPLYWAATTLVVAGALAVPHALSEPLGEGPGYILASYLFIPYLRPDGFIQPVFRLGWTLNYEMLFYVVFALFLPLSRLRATAGVAVAIGALVAWGRFAHPSSPLLVFWTDPIMLEFVAGMGVATLLLAGIRLNGWQCGVMAAVAMAVLIVVNDSDPAWRLLSYGVPATALVAAAVLVRRPPVTGMAAGTPAGTGRDGMLAVGVLLGDASYAIYLLHPFPMRLFREVWARLHWTGTAGILSYIVVTVILATLGGVVIHWYGERPVTRAARRVLGV